MEEQVLNIRRELVLKRPENEGSVNFKHSSCKNQFDFNSKRIAELYLAEDYLRICRLEDAREVIKQTKGSLAERNRHVKIADNYGRDTLEEYMGNDLVNGPDETAKLRKAESRSMYLRYNCMVKVFNQNAARIIEVGAIETD